MNNIKLTGTSNFGSGDQSEITIDGVGKCDGNMEAKSLKIDGVFECQGTITTELLSCDGVCELHGDIKAKTIDVDGVVKMKGRANIQAEKIICDGVIDSAGQVSADYIQADGVINAEEIVGDEVNIINRKIGTLGFAIFVGGLSKIELIEATTINLKGVRAGQVNGSNITIGSHCQIAHLDCNGSLKIDPKAKIEKITGEYTLVE